MPTELLTSDSPRTIRMIRAEFEEMPGMHLTLAQAARLWDMPREACERVLEHLVGTGFLVRHRSRTYARRAGPR
jgi:DNA-binding IclR family transcriptional regulator